MTIIIRTIILALVAGLGYWVYQNYYQGEHWIGVVYRDRTDEFSSVEIGEFGSLDACRKAALATIKSLRIPDALSGYECRLNCEIADSASSAEQCDKVMR